MDIKFASSYSRIKKKAWETDMLCFPSCIRNDVYYKDRWNKFSYDTNDNRIHYLRYFEKNTPVDLFYLNNYKTINQNIIQHLPFDTQHFVTQEVIGNSIYVRKIKNKQYFFTKYKERNDDLDNLLRTGMNCKYLIDKYSKTHTLEFRLYNNDIYLVNVFDNNGCMQYQQIKKIAEQFEIHTPKEINSLIFRQGIKTLDTFYNDFYLDDNNFVFERNYYITFYFQNNKTLLYKIKQ